MTEWKSIALIFLAMVCMGCTSATSATPGQGEDEGITVIYRDSWGVPHIYAPTAGAGAYAMGWAQAEDRPEALLKNFLRGIGQIASVEGPDAVQSDLIARLWDNYDIAKRNAHKIDDDARGVIQAYVRGVNDFYAAHPEDVPSWWGEREVDEYMVIAFGRFFLYSWSIGDVVSDLARGGIEMNFKRAGRASNQLAIAPGRSANGSAILIIDPHLAWWGASRFWEFRIHAGDLSGSGFTLAGFPAIGLGHNENLAWAMTTGGPDTADIYELTIDPDDNTRYLYDGEWRTMTQREIAIEMNGVDEPKKITILDSHLGPVLAEQNGKAYAARMAYAEEVEVIEAWFKLGYATDYQGAVDAMASQQIFPQNIMVADTSGNIYYQRTGRVPRRPEGYDFSKPVDGSTSATDWQGFHPASDHVQVLNPPQGYMQNCNIPPDAMMIDSQLLLDGRPAYLFSDRSHTDRRGTGLDGWTNQRGARAVELLAADDSVTVEDAMAMVLDLHPYGSSHWIAALEAADAAAGEAVQNSDLYIAGIEDLLGWDQELARDSTGALKYAYWRESIVSFLGKKDAKTLAKKIDFYLEANGKKVERPALSEQDQNILVLALKGAMERLNKNHGSLTTTYGEVFRVGRGDRSWPVGGGGNWGLGQMTLRTVNYGEPRDDGTRWGHAGQTSTQVVVLSKPIQSWSAPPIGQSDRPDSPHYSDQAEKLLSERTMKPTNWVPEDLASDVQSREVLAGAQ